MHSLTGGQVSLLHVRRKITDKHKLKQTLRIKCMKNDSKIAMFRNHMTI